MPVLIVVFDGLQPAQITPQQMPRLSDWASRGVSFARNHPVYPTVTRANAASLVTGTYPGTHGVAANTMMFRSHDPVRVIPVLQPTLAAIAKQGEQVLLSPTLADLLSQHGLEYVAIGVGTSGNAYVHNPKAEQSGGATIHPDFTLPSPLHAQLLEKFGPWPKEALPNTPRMSHAVDILTHYILPERNPAVTLIWSSEPDKAQHAAGVGSDLSQQALGEADAQFGRILVWLEQNGRYDDTDVIVVSDHGYSTIAQVTSLEDELRAAGFGPGNAPGGVAVAPNGGSALFYTYESDPSTTARLAEWLMGKPWCGPLLASESAGPIAGTIPAAACGVQGPRAPELTMSFGWSSHPNEAGFAGQVGSTGGRVGQGTHGSMSRHELRNVLLASGPRFKERTVVENPTGNLDLAPTILHLLGLDSPPEMNGRVLREGLSIPQIEETPEFTTDILNAERQVGNQVYRQQIKLCRMGETFYLEEGSSTLGPR